MRALRIPAVPIMIRLAMATVLIFAANAFAAAAAWIVPEMHLPD